MSTIGGANIVREGLLLYLDGANQRSYVSGSPVWRSISSNQYSASLINGPGYDSSSLGSLTFDGINDRAIITGSTKLVTNPNLNQENKTNPIEVLSWYPIYNNFSISFICKPSTSITIRTESTSGATGTSGQRYITENTKAADGQSNGAPLISVGTNAIQVFDHGDGYMPCLLSYPVEVSSIINLCVVYSEKKPILYLDGILVRSGLTSQRANMELAFPGICSTFYTPFSGNVYALKLYNRTLSPEEVLQNYEALKSRYI